MKRYSISVAALLFGVGTIYADAQPPAASADRLARPSTPTARAAQMPLTDVAAADAAQVSVGANGHILLRSSDGHIDQADVPVDLLLTAVSFADAQQGWAVGHDGVILHSTDGGRHWALQLDGNAINQMTLDAAKADLARAQQASDAHRADKNLGSALEAAQFMADDADAAAKAGPSRPLLDVWFRDASDGWAVGAYGVLLHTADGGASWRYVSTLDNPDRLHLNAVRGLPDGSLLIAGEGGRIYRSPDDGRHWSPVQKPTPASLYKLIVLPGTRQVLALGFGGTLLSSADGGASWHVQTTNSEASLYGGTRLSDGSLMLVGQGGTVLQGGDVDHLSLRRLPSKATLMGVTDLGGGQVALVGNAGLSVVSSTDREGKAP